MFTFIATIFNEALYRPLFNALIALYAFLPLHDFGLAVICLTLLIKFLLLPFGLRAAAAQKKMLELQPKLNAIKEKHKGDMEKQTMATMALYKQEKVNVFSGILPLLIQLPILLALYQVFYVFRADISDSAGLLYSFVSLPHINTTFLGILDLIAPSATLAVIAAILQFVQVKMATPQTTNAAAKKNDFSQIMQKQMIFMAPLFTLFILLKLPSVLGLYWTVATIFSIAQQYYVMKKYVQPART